MAAIFTRIDGDIREVMRTMIKSTEFWDPVNFRSKVKSPLEMVASAIRSVNGDVDFAFGINGLMTQLGEPLYRKLEPTGYSNQSTEWMNSASLLARMNFANALPRSRSTVSTSTLRSSGETASIEQRILLTRLRRTHNKLFRPEADPAIRSGHNGPKRLGSPDFKEKYSTPR